MRHGSLNSLFQHPGPNHQPPQVYQIVIVIVVVVVIVVVIVIVIVIVIVPDRDRDMSMRQSLPALTPATLHRPSLQRYLVDKKQRPPRTLQ